MGDSVERESLRWLLEALAQPPEGGDEQLGAGTQIGRYRLIERLGRGGFGVVFRAVDTELGRQVALKLLHATARSADAEARLLREAQAMARLKHPNLVTVYDVGSLAEGRLFLAMELVDGVSLRRWLDEKRSLAGEGWRHPLALFIAAGHGLAAAHRAGIIHRDFKPDNVLVADGRVCVADFGLARSVEAAEPTTPTTPTKDAPGPLTTQTGTILGTPAYMAPEQLRGEKSDAAADQFSFCVALFEALYGTRPFGGVTIDEKLRAMLSGELAAGLRRVGPSALRETIERGLAATPTQRHASMDALVDALENIAAARQRWLKRAVIGGGALLVTVGALFAGQQFRARQQAIERVRVAQKLGEEMRDIEASLRFTYMQPRHDLLPEERQVRQRMSDLQQHLDRLGDVGEGAGEYALGRGYLALRDIEAARRHLESAWSRGYHAPEVQEALGQAIGTLYQSQREAVRGTDAVLRARRYEELRRRYREPALAYLSGNTRASSYTRGLMAFYSEHYDEALTLAAALQRETPWFYEALQLEGDVYVEQCRQRLEAGDVAAALTHCQRAGAIYAQAIDRARSDPALYVRDCERLTLTLALQARGGEPEAETYQQGLARCQEALALDTTRAATIGATVSCHQEWIDAALDHGRDVRPAITTALALLSSAGSSEAEPVRLQGRLYSSQARYESDNGRDPSSSFELAQAAFATARSRGSLEAAEDLGQLFRVRALYERSRSHDPRAWLRQAADSLRASNSDFVLPELAEVYALSAREDYDRGDDPRPHLEAGLAAVGEARRTGRDAAELWGREGTLHLTRAYYEQRGNGPAKASYDSAVASYEKQVALTPSSATAWKSLGNALDTEASYVFVHDRQDPRPLLERALAALQRSLASNPRDARGWGGLAGVYARFAAWEHQHGQDPTHHLQQARAALDTSYGIVPDDGYILPQLGDLEFHLAEWLKKVHRSPHEACARGLAFNRRTLQIKRGNPDTDLDFAWWAATCADYKIQDGIDAAPEIAEGQALTSESLRLSPRPSARATEAWFLVLQARTAKGATKKRALAQAAVAIFDEAIRSLPSVAKDFDDVIAEARRSSAP